MDRVIRGGSVYDGTGAEPLVADVGIEGDRIVAIGPDLERGDVEIDARGLAVAPGFIDVHTHDDFAVFLYPDMEFKTRQGVTTNVVGNCGFGAAPHAMGALMAGGFHPGAKLPDYEGYAGYLERLDTEPAAPNTAVLVGHGTVRLDAMRGGERAPDSGELERMRKTVREGIDAGAVGFSTGLVYEPGRHAATDEIVALSEIMAGGRGLYATHMRNEGLYLVDAVREAIEIGERAGVPVQISHHKASGKSAWGSVAESLAEIERARARGLDVTADQYPYTAGSTVLVAVVAGLDPDDPEGIDPHDLQLCSVPSQPELEGLRLDVAAERIGLPARDAAARLIEVDGSSVIIAMHSMCEDDVKTVMRHPTTMIGSDGIPALEGRPHPRLYGTFARVLGHYARDEAVLPLAEAVHRMTGLSARKFKLRDRGELRAGAFADVVVFDPARVRDAATFDDPHRPAEGIPHVIVNGTPVVHDGEPTGARPGRALRRDA